MEWKEIELLIASFIERAAQITECLVIGCVPNQLNLSFLFHQTLIKSIIFTVEHSLSFSLPIQQKRKGWVPSLLWRERSVGSSFFCGAGERHNGINEGMNWWNVLPRCKRASGHNPQRNQSIRAAHFFLSLFGLAQPSLSIHLSIYFSFFNKWRWMKGKDEMAWASLLFRLVALALPAPITNPKNSQATPILPLFCRASLFIHKSIINSWFVHSQYAWGEPARNQPNQSILPIRKRRIELILVWLMGARFIWSY